MSKQVKYHVAGRFEGQFKTLQDLALKSGEPFPEGSKHLIRVYRGSIFNHHSINQEDFRQSVGEISGQHVNNIEITASEHWPVEHTRIFSLGQFKLLNAEISVVHSINGRTYGKILGDITASVTEGEYEEQGEKQDENPRQPWQIWKDQTENNNSDNPKTPSPSPIDPGPGPLRRGCRNVLNAGNGCLNWILWLILIAALLYWLFYSTEWGQQMICRFQNWRLKRELAEVQEERRKLEETVEKTRPLASQCGGAELFKGTNQQQRFTYTLGQTSGNVLIAYDMFDVPDRIEVMFNGRLVAETNDNFIESKDFKYLENMGFADKRDTLVFPYVFNPNELHELTIRVVPNQDKETTQWQFNVICPQ
jgi:hypothetical protein